jgi:hypothetical protein
MEFKSFQSTVQKQFKAMSEKTLFQLNVDKDRMWDKYLTSFPAGSNPIYKKRTEHDCSCFRRFVKVLGGVVNISDGRSWRS